MVPLIVHRMAIRAWLVLFLNPLANHQITVPMSRHEMMHTILVPIINHTLDPIIESAAHTIPNLTANSLVVRLLNPIHMGEISATINQWGALVQQWEVVLATIATITTRSSGINMCLVVMTLGTLVAMRPPDRQSNSHLVRTLIQVVE